MTKKDEVNKLLSNMKSSASGARDLTNYKDNQAWPGRKYMLVGNSFHVGEGAPTGNSKEGRRRKAAIAAVLSGGRYGKENLPLASVEEALKNEEYRSSLSRFEYDWLKRQPPSTMIGPAYDEKGKLLPSSFAVWRLEPVYAEPDKAPAKASKQKQLAKSR